jgi:hypothetical protein
MKSRFLTGLSAAAAVVLSSGVALGEDANVTVPTESILQDLAAALETDAPATSTRLRLAYMLQNLGQHAQAQVILDEVMAEEQMVANALQPGAQIAAGDCEGCELGNVGADVIVGDLNGIGLFGSATINGVLYRAYAIGTTSCNVGTQNLSWQQNNNLHPVIAQNIYRYDGRRFEQIGMSHLKHGFCALQQGICQTPQNPCQPTGGSCMQSLGIFCSDPYDVSLNATQSRLGPRWQVNPYTGVFQYPFHSAPMDNNTLGRRIRIADSDLTTDSSVRYFAEGQYVTRDDALAGNGGNNASYREIRYFASGQFAFLGSTVRTKPAIEAWKAVDSNVLLDIVEPANDGRFYIASRAYDNGDGTWDYEYAVFNLNNDAAAASFAVPVGNAPISSTRFKDINYHTNDGINGVTQDATDWNSVFRDGDMVWELVDNGANSNALRWGTMYNFGFTSSAEPEETDATIGFFKNSGSITARVVAPRGCELVADTDGNNVINFLDLNTVLSEFGQSGKGLAGDVNGDGVVSFLDLNAVLSEFGLDCN